MPLLTFPLALFALATIPALVSIYWLRNRYRRQAVSSLLLWADVQRPREGGLKLQRLQTPLALLLELAALALLALAATDPRVFMEDARRPLAVVLDDSYSMTAGDPGETPRDRAVAALDDVLAAEGDAPVTLITAGRSPQVLAERIAPREAAVALQRWTCEADTAELQPAIALATELSRAHARILVLTDHAPPGAPDSVEAGRVQWRATGRPRGNVAFINAVRSAEDDRVLLEVANLSDESAATTLNVTGRPESLRLAPRERRRLWLQAPRESPLTVQLGDDAIAIDNRVVLAPESHPSVRVALNVSDAALARALERALESAGRAQLVPQRPHLVITQQDAGRPKDPDAWVVRFLDPGGDPVAFAGPFVADRAHPLTEGISFGGVIWAVGGGDTVSDTPEGGRPVVMAGNTPLVTESVHAFGQREVTLSLRPALSTFLATPGFPSLVWNLLDWRAAHLPGLETANIRVGGEARLALPRGVESVTLISPDGEERALPANDGVVGVRAARPGLYTVRTGEAEDAPAWRFAVNALSPRESDATAAAAGQWGQWIDDDALHREYRSVAWVLLLLALGVILAHAYVVYGRGRQPG